MKDFLQRWIINTLAVLAAVHIVHGLSYDRWIDVVLASLILGILNALVKPMLMLLSVPLLVVTLGSFYFVINALLLWLTGLLLKDGFRVEGFWPAFWGALVISLVTLVLNTVTGTGGSRFKIVTSKSRRKAEDDKVIDV
jgi:putative membrane protein